MKVRDIERSIIKDLGVESFGFYTKEKTLILALHFVNKLPKWEEERVKEYISTIIPNATFL